MARKLSPAQAHLSRARSAAASADARGGPAEAYGSHHDLLLAQLVSHRRTLKDIQSVERKIEAKRGMVGDFDDWITATLAGDAGRADEIVTTMMIWHIDIGAYRRAFEIAAYVVRHGLELPDQYERNVATLLIDEFSVPALAGKMTDDAARELLPAVLELTAPSDAPDQARAKLHKAIGFALIGRLGKSDFDVATVPADTVLPALEHLHRAIELFREVGCKKDIEKLERRAKALASGDSTTDRTPEPGGSGEDSTPPAES